MDNSIDPNDKLLRKTWSDPDKARRFLQGFLPQKLLELVSLTTLEICEGSFIETDIKANYFDLLYKADFSGTPCYFYLVFEYNGNQDNLTLQQIGKYILKISRFLAISDSSEHNKPIILPLVLYLDRSGQAHGNIRFLAMLDSSAGMDEDTNLLLKDVYDDQVKDKLREVSSLLGEEPSERPISPQLIKTLFQFIICNIEGVTVDKLTIIVKESMSEQYGDIIMTLAEELRNEGFEKGVQQGLIQGIKEMTIDLIEIKFGQTPDAQQLQQLVQEMDNIETMKAFKEKIKAGATIAELKMFVNPKE